MVCSRQCGRMLVSIRHNFHMVKIRTHYGGEKVRRISMTDNRTILRLILNLMGYREDKVGNGMNVEEGKGREV